jgi:putative membrane protein
MVEYEGRAWASVIFRWRGSVIGNLLPRVLLAATIGVAAEGLYRTSSLSLPPIGHSLLGAALGLLLVFRTHAAYERYWEARRLLGGLAHHARDLTRQIGTYLGTEDQFGRAEKRDLRRLVIAFYRLVAQSLRGERDLASLGEVLSSGERAALEDARGRPAVVASWISHRLAQEVRRTGTPEERLLAMDANLAGLLEAWGGCDRIRTTPVPFAYAQHVKVFVTLWCFSVPFALVDALRLYTPVAAALLAFALFGIEEVAVEIEQPFGRDANDLPLDPIGDGIVRSTKEILELGAQPPHADRSASNFPSY